MAERGVPCGIVVENEQIARLASNSDPPCRCCDETEVTGWTELWLQQTRACQASRQLGSSHFGTLFPTEREAFQANVSVWFEFKPFPFA